MTGYSVSEVNRFIKQLFASEDIFYSISVCGELSNFNHHRSGHMFFTLKDDASQLKCVLFKQDAERVPFLPRNGMQVVVRGDIRVFERDGVYQLYAVSMRQQGEGKQQQTLAVLAQKLLAEGLFDPARKQPLPPFPQVVGVVTAPGAAALQDIIHILSRRCPVLTLRVYPAQVQGEDAPASLCAAIRRAQADGPDLLIVGRGGGSAEDLAAFNDEAVVRAVAACPVPVVSAVGHETDSCLCDLAADLRAPTPSAAAELAVPDVQELKKSIDNTKKLLYNTLQERLAGERTRLRLLQSRLESRSPAAQLQLARLRLDNLSQRLRQLADEQLQFRRTQLLARTALLESLSPLQVLRRGYAIAFDEQGRALRSVARTRPGRILTVRLADGELTAAVTGKKAYRPKQGAQNDTTK